MRALTHIVSMSYSQCKHQTQIVNYLFVITLTPPAVIIHHMYFKGFGPEGWCNINEHIKSRFGYGPKVVEGSTIKDKQSNADIENKNDSVTGIEMKGAFKSDGSLAVVVADEEKAHENHSIEVTEDTEILSKVLICAYEAELPESWGKLKVQTRTTLI